MRLFNLTFDAHEPAALAQFWSAVLARPVGGYCESFAFIDRTPTSPAVILKVPEGNRPEVRAAG